jgi:hypothetical protein
MATTYKFQVSMPVNDTLPRNRMANVIHLQHVVGALADTDLEAMCADIAELWQTRYANTSNEVQVKAYDVDAVPNYPRADVVVNAGVAWAMAQPREICCCLSFAGIHKGNRRQRGRIYLEPGISSTTLSTGALRPPQAVLDWCLQWYTEPNASLPDLGGVDWQFGIYSVTGKSFTQAQQAWVNDDWDVQRRRGLRESTRVQATREG